MQLFRGALDALQVVAQGARHSLFHDCGFLCHIVFEDLATSLPFPLHAAAIRRRFPVWPFWKADRTESTPRA